MQILPKVLWKIQLIILYSSTVYRDYDGLGFLAPKYVTEFWIINHFIVCETIRIFKVDHGTALSRE